MSKVKGNFVVHRDHNSRTCIEVARDKMVVQYIPMEILGFSVESLNVNEFGRIYSPMANYPIDQACLLYKGYAVTLGATKEALDYLGQVINITQSEYDMATKKIAATTKPVEKKAVAKASEKKTPPAKAPVKTATKVPEKKPATPPRRRVGERKGSASQMFQELIMAGKLSDDGIFAAVQKEFDLDDSKKSYVKWYRGKLKKDGKNPPEPR